MTADTNAADTKSRYTLSLTVNIEEGAIERVLGVIRRRSHTVASVAAVTSDNCWSVLIGVETDRPIAPLVRQLRNLVDVTDAAVA